MSTRKINTTVLGQMILDAAWKKTLKTQDVSTIYEVVTGVRPAAGAPVQQLRHGIRHEIVLMSHRDITLKYDQLKQLRLL